VPIMDLLRVDCVELTAGSFLTTTSCDCAVWRYLKSTMGNIALIQTFRKEEQMPETRDRKVKPCACHVSL